MRMPMSIPLVFLLGTVTSVAVTLHQQTRNVHSRIRQHPPNGASVNAFSFVQDALLHGTNNHAAALPRFKSRAPYQNGDSQSRKTISGGNGNATTTTTTTTTPSPPPPKEDEKSSDDNSKKDEDDAVFKVVPGAQMGLKIEPMPGMKDPTVYVRSPDKYSQEAASAARGYVQESQLTSITKLKDAIDTSENRIKGLKLRAVEKQNFLDSLRKRERLLESDVAQDQTAVQNLLNHIDALDLRLTRLKKENELKQLSTMYENYTSKALNLQGEAAGLSTARDALFDRIQTMHSTIGGLREREDANERMAVNSADDPLQTYGYAGALTERKESLQQEMARQMEQVALQQNLLQKQLGVITGVGSGVKETNSGSGSGSGSGAAGAGSGSGSGK